MFATNYSIWLAPFVACVLMFIGVTYQGKQCPSRGETIIMVLVSVCPMLNILVAFIGMIYIIGEFLAANADWFAQPICPKKNKER